MLQNAQLHMYKYNCYNIYCSSQLGQLMSLQGFTAGCRPNTL